MQSTAFVTTSSAQAQRNHRLPAPTPSEDRGHWLLVSVGGEAELLQPQPSASLPIKLQAHFLSSKSPSPDDKLSAYQGNAPVLGQR